MAERRCEECGSIIPDGAKACPNCGCPVEDAHNNEQANENDWQTESAFIHEHFNEKEPYSPFKSNSWFFKDPWPMYNYPIGALDRKHPFIGWIFGPWHLTCKDPKEQEEYDVLNNIFYFFNLIVKIVIYCQLWTICKLWKIFIPFVIIVFGLTYLNYKFTNVLALVITMAFYILTIITFLFAIGKALHRYWPQLWRVTIRFNKRAWSKVFPKIS